MSLLEIVRNSDEWLMAKCRLSPVYANRTGENHFNHVVQGVAILGALPNVDIRTAKAFCLHPLLQSDEMLKENALFLDGLDPVAVALAMEYRWVANAGTRRKDYRSVKITLPEIEQMLIADKVQNAMVFHEKYPMPDSSGPYKEYEEYLSLGDYFDWWLDKLNIDGHEYDRLVRVAKSVSY